MIIEFGWQDAGPVCKVHAGPCFFEWVPVLVQEELFSDIDTVFSVSGLVEVEESFDRIRSNQINPSLQQVSFFSEVL